MPTVERHAPRPVVAAAIIDEDGRLLAAQRSYPADLCGQFELPGGKIEDGETPAEALVREILEELGCHITLTTPVLSPDPDGTWPILGGRRMTVWMARANTAPQCGDGHLALEWVSGEEALRLDWLAPNRPIVEAVIQLISSSETTDSPEVS